ncbi:hypothetical protein [Burkholderia glumae]|uniref:hypothetical protein n=1 Tax=Burkholderia glumae TaxID=337 RepID=UPI0021502629|nr:hypothetical protein [Burkholderia glumae]
MDAKKLKPFDLEAAKRGEPLVTRDGRKVTEFHHFETLVYRDCCCAIVDGFRRWINADGRYYIEGESNHDLFMAPRKVTRWVNLYNAPTVHHLARCAYHYPTEEDARRDADSSAIAVAIPVEIEV